MGRWGWIVGVLVVLGLALWAWPLASAAAIASTVRQGDPARIADAIDTPELRRSLARQIARAYLQVSGKADKLGAFGRSVAGAAVTTVADPYVAELLTPDNLAALLSQGHVAQVKVGDRTVAVKGDVPKLSGLLDGNVLSLVTGSYYDGLRDFVIPIGGEGPQDRYTVHLHLDGLSWKVGGIDLPPALVEDMARSLLQAESQAAL